MICGFDVTPAQGEIDWRVLRNNRRDLAFCYIRLADSSYGEDHPRNGLLDEHCEKHLWWAARCGIVPGVWVRARPTMHTPEAEAVQLVTRLRAVGAYGYGYLKPAVSLDDPVDLSVWLAEFVHVYRELSPTDDLTVHASGSYIEHYYASLARIPHDVRVWVDHPTRCDTGFAAPEDWAGRTPYRFGGRAVLHQYTHTGALPGITGPVALDCLLPGVPLRDVMAT